MRLTDVSNACSSSSCILHAGSWSLSSFQCADEEQLKPQVEDSHLGSVWEMGASALGRHEVVQLKA